MNGERMQTARDSEETLAALENHPFVRGIERKFIVPLAACARLLRYEAGSVLAVRDEHAAQVYLLVEGRVEVSGPEARNVLGEGDVLGIHEVSPELDWSVDARATEPVLAIVFDRERVTREVERLEGLGLALTMCTLRHDFVKGRPGAQL